jgi:hypothetical protein
VIDLNICYFGDCDVAFSLNGIEGGIKDIEAEGALRIVIKLLPFHAPFVSKIQIYFLSHPTINFELTAALASVNMFVTGELMRSILKEQISSLMVYPNKIQIKLDSKATESTFEMPNIEGVVKLKMKTLQEFNDDENSEMNLIVELGRDVEQSRIETVTDGTVNFNLSCSLIAYQFGVEEIQVSLNTKDADSRDFIVRK